MIYGALLRADLTEERKSNGEGEKINLGDTVAFSMPRLCCRSRENRIAEMMTFVKVKLKIDSSRKG